ncbi:putative nose resistant to fluoxetine protein 6-like [Apostichopus japonicus]|uniref:Putative nose resistant to fluoxetine protein 6-like n=1 Tax=Stichopus japonicus TaxID=307972 RepID=A0A2G8JXU3_STIJA|nr:putative nose resistant to fluoxetine protein 6-like [Apostichopus japonicus]
MVSATLFSPSWKKLPGFRMYMKASRFLLGLFLALMVAGTFYDLNVFGRWYIQDGEIASSPKPNVENGTATTEGALGDEKESTGGIELEGAVNDISGRNVVNRRAERGRSSKALLAFSLATNAPAVLSLKRPESSMGALDGIRVLSMIWIIWHHVKVMLEFTLEEHISTKCDRKEEHISTKCDRKEERISTKCDRKEERISTKCDRKEERISTKCDRKEERISTKCDRKEERISTKCDRKEERSVRNVTEKRNVSVRNVTGKRNVSVRNVTEKRNVSVRNVTEKRNRSVRNVTEKRNVSVRNVTEKRNVSVRNVTEKRHRSVRNVTEKRNVSVRNVTEKRNTSVRNVTEKRNISVRNVTEKRNISEIFYRKKYEKDHASPQHRRTPCVDSFFVLSALLVTYLTLCKIRSNGGRIRWWRFYLNRYLRLTPVYAFCIIMYVSFSHWLGRGYLKNRSYDYEASRCRQYVWSNLLYVNNCIPDPFVLSACLGWTWYLADDMQMFVVTLSSSTSCRDPTIIISPGVEYLIYSNVLTRIQSYMVGVFCGYILYKYKGHPVKIPKAWNTVGWSLSITVAFICVFALGFSSYENPLPAWFVRLWHGCHRFLFSCTVGWIAFACVTGNGGPIGKFLSWEVWLPLSRVSYCVYLFHPVVMLHYVLTSNDQLHWNTYTSVYMFLSFFVATYTVSLAVSLLVEVPLLKMTKLLLDQRPRTQ